MCSSLVATSLNPRERLVHQLACFRRWRELGVDCRSYNTADERQSLLRAGLAPDEVIEIDSAESMLLRTGRENPRILPVLQRLRDQGVKHTVLVNGDIYPAASRDPLPLMASQGDAVGFVRMDCMAVDQPVSAPRTPYHGGLDIFSFGAAGLDAVLRRLTKHAAADGMAFGVPGWDLLLGHMVLAEGGDLLEAPFLLHPRHAAGYNSIAPFAPMANVMLASGRYASVGHVALAEEFVGLIASRCQANTSQSRLLEHAIGDPPLPAARTSTLSFAPAVLQIAAELPGDDVPELLQQQLTRRDWTALNMLYRRLDHACTAMELYLRALRSGLRIRRAAGCEHWTTTYPTTSAHQQQLRYHVGQGETTTRMQGILEIFAVELYEFGVLNTNLLKYVMTQCRHEEEQRNWLGLVRDLHQQRDSHDNPAAAA